MKDIEELKKKKFELEMRHSELEADIDDLTETMNDVWRELQAIDKQLPPEEEDEDIQVKELRKLLVLHKGLPEKELMIQTYIDARLKEIA